VDEIVENRPVIGKKRSRPKAWAKNKNETVKKKNKKKPKGLPSPGKRKTRPRNWAQESLRLPRAEGGPRRKKIAKDDEFNLW
jgi:hypothetical protein